MTIDSPAQTASQAIAQALQQAVAQHQAGHLVQAVELYRAILQIQPHHSDANHNLGLLALEAGQPESALEHFLVVLEANPERQENWLNCIEAMFRCGLIEDARQMLALARQQGLQNAIADAWAVRLQVQPPAAHSANTIPDASAVNALLALFNAAKYSEAADAAQKMTIRFPDDGFGWKALGVALKQLGQDSEALAPMRRAAELLPTDADAHGNLASALSDLGYLEEAKISYQRAVQINPAFIEAHYNLGNTLKLLGHLQEAVTSYREALRIKPEHIRAAVNLGMVLQELGRLDEAETVLRQVLRIAPMQADAYSNLGIVLQELGRLNEAEAAYRRAVEIDPELAEAHNNLGNLLHDAGRLDEAEACYQRALKIKPDFAKARSNLLFCLSQDIEVDAARLFAEHRRYGDFFEAAIGPVSPHENSRDPARQLQVGFVSGDLRNHAVAHYIEPVLAYLSQSSSMSLHAYVTHSADDETTQRLRAEFAHWHAVAGMTDAALAEKIRQDGIDILIDLAGHSSRNRLLAFVRKPAPIQISWVGYPGTTGLQAMDYFLTDQYLVPRGILEEGFTEKIIYLPASVAFMPSPEALAVNALPMLRNGYITFASFNRLSKLTEGVIALWSQLLRAVPDSRMMLAGLPTDLDSDELAERFASQGVARDRLSFYGRCGMAEYLEFHHQADICLDTFPYSGGTTTLHALWMGVPTLTLAGATVASRSSASILGNVGLPEFVAADATEFVAKGVSWANNSTALAAIREGLRDRFAKSAMAQPELIASSLERALRIMWQRWCAGLPVATFEVVEGAGQ